MPGITDQQRRRLALANYRCSVPQARCGNCEHAPGTKDGKLYCRAHGSPCVAKSWVCDSWQPPKPREPVK